MKLIKSLIFLLLMINNALAKPNYSELFTGYNACFILYNLNKEHITEVFNSERCDKKIAPCSTFKIPLIQLLKISNTLFHQNYY